MGTPSRPQQRGREVRHRPSRNRDLPVGFENNIFLEVSESYRGKGYGHTLLQLALAEARRIGLPAVRLTVLNSHAASRRLIEAQGAVLLQSFTAKTGEIYHLYEIELT